MFDSKEEKQEDWSDLRGYLYVNQKLYDRIERELGRKMPGYIRVSQPIKLDK